MRNRYLLALLAAALMVAPFAVNAQTVTYNFTGTVTSASFAYDLNGPTLPAVGTLVTGTYTFFPPGIPPAYTGAFSSAITIGSLIFDDGGDSLVSVPSDGTAFSALSGLIGDNGSLVNIQNAGAVVVGSNNLPLPFAVGNASDSGALFRSATVNLGGSNPISFSEGVSYHINSLSVAPEIDPPSAAGGLTLLLGSLLALRGRRSPCNANVS